MSVPVSLGGVLSGFSEAFSSISALKFSVLSIILFALLANWYCLLGSISPASIFPATSNIWVICLSTNLSVLSMSSVLVSLSGVSFSFILYRLYRLKSLDNETILKANDIHDIL